MQERFNWAEAGMGMERPIFSYGPCQFPTLGLIVQRHWCCIRPFPCRALHLRACLPERLLMTCVRLLPGAYSTKTRIRSTHVRIMHAVLSLTPGTPPSPHVCREIRAHVAERFWYIHAAYRSPEGHACAFTWQRGHIFDHAIAAVLYETCVDAPQATITKARRNFT